MLTYKPGGYSWCRSTCHTSHSGTGSLQCACACAPTDCVWHRMREGRMYTHEAVVQHASSCVSEGSTCAGKPCRRPRRPPVFRPYARAHGHAAPPRSQTCAHILRSDGATSARARFRRGRMLPLCRHRQDTAPDAASVHTVISSQVITPTYHRWCHDQGQQPPGIVNSLCFPDSPLHY